MESPLPRLPSLDLGRFKVAIAFEGGRSEVAIAFKGKTYMWSIRVPSIRCRSITHRFVCMYPGYVYNWRIVCFESGLQTGLYYLAFCHRIDALIYLTFA